MAELTRFCWQDTGVYGDRSCERLAGEIHCRNCAEFSRLGRTLFDREMTAEFEREWSERTAAAKGAGTDGAVSMVVFRLREEWFALRTVIFEQISECHPVHRVPFRSGGAFHGLVNVNGELLLCASLGRLLSVAETSAGGAGDDPRRRVCVIRRERERTAFVVDEVLGIRLIAPGSAPNAPVTVTRAPAAHTVACLRMEEREVGLLDEAHLFESLGRSLRW